MSARTKLWNHLNKKPVSMDICNVPGDPEVTANLYYNFAYPYWEGCVICSIYFICGNFWVIQYIHLKGQVVEFEIWTSTKLFYRPNVQSILYSICVNINAFSKIRICFKSMFDIIG